MIEQADSTPTGTSSSGASQPNANVHVVESASATTSEDNQKSGNAAYFITAGALVVLIALSMGLSGCISAIANRALRDAINYSQDNGSSNGYGLGNGNGSGRQYGYGYGYGNGSGSGSSSGSSVGSSLSVSDALNLNLSVYNVTIEDGVSASDYSGVSNEVRSYVLSIVRTDSDANAQVVNHLDAAIKADDPKTEVEAAISVCDDTIAKLQAVEVPSFSGSDATDAQDGKTKAVERWTNLKAELQLLDTSDEVSTSDLEKADNKVYDSTASAAEALSNTLMDSATSR